MGISSVGVSSFGGAVYQPADKYVGQIQGKSLLLAYLLPWVRKGPTNFAARCSWTQLEVRQNMKRADRASILLASPTDFFHQI
jgi:hypothetical protein